MNANGPVSESAYPCTPPSSAAACRSPRVLVAEDDDALRRLLANALRRDGMDVIEVRSGSELLERLGSLVLNARFGLTIDLVITDVRMPGSTGLRVLAGLRRAFWSTPVILMTGFGDPATHDEARRLGVRAVFDKPFDVRELCRVASSIVGADATEERSRHSAEDRGDGRR